MKEFTDLLKKKAEEQAHSPVDSSKMEAKAAAIKNLMEEMRSLMGSDLKDGLKKVTVASDSSEGLKEGLDKAQSLMGEMPEEESEEEESMESPEFEASEDESAEHGSDEDKKIAELEKQLLELKAKKKA